MNREELQAAKDAIIAEREAEDLAVVDAYIEQITPDSTLDFLTWKVDADWLAGKPITDKRVVAIGGRK
jgi:hypothetical protein